MQSSFVYSIKWVEFIFCSRPVTEELLTPEREAGNLTSADYEKAVNFLPRAKQYSYRPIAGLILFSAVAALGIRYRRPTWSNLQKLSAASSFGVVGYTLGKFTRIKAHAEFLSSIENPRGFAEAVRNIESRTGLHNHSTPGPKFSTIIPGTSPEDLSLEKPVSTVHPSNSTTYDTAKPPQPSSRWDQIRKANSNGPATTTWDALRQRHEKESEP